MSSSSSNAAARRRRAGPPPVQNVARPAVGGMVNPNARPMPAQQQRRPMPAQQQQQRPMPAHQSPAQQQQQQQNSRPVQTPAQMLISHEKRLGEIEELIPDLVGKVSQVSGPAPSQPVQSQVDQRVSRLEKALEALESSSGKEKSCISVDRIAYLEKTIKELESRFVDMTKHYHLLHSFATETNIMLMKVINSQPCDAGDENDGNGDEDEEQYPPIDSEQTFGASDMEGLGEMEYNEDELPTFGDDNEENGEEECDDGCCQNGEEGCDDGEKGGDDEDNE